MDITTDWMSGVSKERDEDELTTSTAQGTGHPVSIVQRPFLTPRHSHLLRQILILREGQVPLSDKGFGNAHAPFLWTLGKLSCEQIGPIVPFPYSWKPDPTVIQLFYPSPIPLLTSGHDLKATGLAQKRTKGSQPTWTTSGMAELRR